jgi:hypothetical protein
MWEVKVVCSDPDCAEEIQLWVEDIEEVDAEVCACGGCVFLVSVASFEPLVPAGR